MKNYLVEARDSVHLDNSESSLKKDRIGLSGCTVCLSRYLAAGSAMRCLTSVLAG